RADPVEDRPSAAQRTGDFLVTCHGSGFCPSVGAPAALGPDKVPGLTSPLTPTIEGVGPGRVGREEKTMSRSPLLDRPGAVEAVGVDAGVAWHYGDPIGEQP